MARKYWSKRKKKNKAWSIICISIILIIIGATSYFSITKTQEKQLPKKQLDINTTRNIMLTFDKVFRSARLNNNNDLEVNKIRLHYEILRELTSKFGDLVKISRLNIQDQSNNEYFVHLYIETKQGEKINLKKKLTFTSILLK